MSKINKKLKKSFKNILYHNPKNILNLIHPINFIKKTLLDLAK